MKHVFRSIPIAVLISTLVLASACTKFVEVDVPQDQIASSVVFSDDAAAASAIAGLYSSMMSSEYFFTNGGITIAAGLSADEIYNRISGSDEEVFYQNSISPSNEFVINIRLWSAAYKSIYHANAIIEGLQKSNSLSAPLKSQLEGEAKFIRAFHYFYLTNLFGDVPLVLTTDYKVNSVLPRTPITKVYEQIVADLKDAQALMTPDYPSSDRVRPNKWTAMALLSRAYLFQRDWKAAEAAASEVINSGLYSLAEEPGQVFMPSSNEIIWQLLPVAGSKTPTEAQAFLPADFPSARPFFPLTVATANSFEPGDKRQMQWIQRKTVNGIEYYYTTKYKVKVPSGDPAEYNVVLRLAELYLIRAEARAEQENISGSQSDLDVIRNRAGLPNTATSDQSSLFEVIEKENRVEFLTEWGHRWFDLKRWGKADVVLSPIKTPNWQPTDVLYPIPLTEIKRNPFLEQNPGY